MNYAKYIDHTLLKPESTKEQIDNIISEAREYEFKSVCINPLKSLIATNFHFWQTFYKCLFI